MNDAEFLSQFEACTFPFDQWKHRQHVKAAYLYLSRHPIDQAIDRMRTGIQRYNAAHLASQPDHQPSVGYHETLTLAWMRVIHATLRAFGAGETADAFCDEHPHLVQRTLLRLYYSREHMMSSKAKHSFVEPDLAPLP